MLFNTSQFLWFIVPVWVVYWAVKTPARQNALLLVASLVFYGAWDARFVTLLLLSVATDYCCGRAMGRESSPQRRQRWLLLSLCVNLGILGFFKYFDFFSDSAATLLAQLGFSAEPLLLDLVLPVGISFYTFQTLGYSVDVYRRRIQPELDWIRFATYVCYFPQLVAGPIERSERLLPQLRAQRTWKVQTLVSALELTLRGLFKKAVVADNVAPVVDYIFAQPVQSLSAGDVLLGVFAFAMQIYGDFSGYTDMARGISRSLGIELMVNFEAPYFARNPSDFWRRWHISLSSWLRDYLYVPLGGNRGSHARTQLNLFTTMLLGGLWHGAAWNFVLWGGYHGAILALHRRFLPLQKHGQGRVHSLWPLVFFPFTLFGWLLFRVTSLEQLEGMLEALAFRSLSPQGGASLWLNVLHFTWFAWVLQLMQWLWPEPQHKLPGPLMRLALSGYMLWHVVTEGEFGHASQFIYFQF